MKMIAAAVLTATALSASAQSPEALRFAADAALIQALPHAVAPDLEEPREPILQAPLVPVPAGPFAATGATVAKTTLSSISQNARHIMTKTFGARALDLGVASDAAFSSYFLVFTGGNSSTLAALGDLNRLRGDGVNARVDASTVYNFKVSINIFSPVRGSTLKMTPVQGTRGPQNDVKTGTLLDAIRAKSVVFKAHGQELWMLYGADAKPDASGFADTNSFLFIKEDGLSSKAWPLAASKVPAGTPVVVDLGGNKITLTLSASGELTINE